MGTGASLAIKADSTKTAAKDDSEPHQPSGEATRRAGLGDVLVRDDLRQLPADFDLNNAGTPDRVVVLNGREDEGGALGDVDRRSTEPVAGPHLRDALRGREYLVGAVLPDACNGVVVGGLPGLI